MTAETYYKKRDTIIHKQAMKSNKSLEELLEDTQNLDKQFYGDTYITPSNTKEYYEKSIVQNMKYRKLLEDE